MAAGEIRGALTQPNDDPAISWVQLVCTDGGRHPRRKIGLISWADDGQEVILHLRKHHGADGRIILSQDARSVLGTSQRFTLNRKCQVDTCSRHHEWRSETLKQMIEAVGAPGCVVLVDLSKVH